MNGGITSISQNTADHGGIQFNAPISGDVRLDGRQYQVSHWELVLGSNDPQEAMDKIEDEKGEVLDECFRWILDDRTFRNWMHSTPSGLLRIEGGMGRGKTMMMIGLIKRLSKHQNNIQLEDPMLSFFFCQENSDNHNCAAGVLRGLLWKLAERFEAVQQHIRRRQADLHSDGKSATDIVHVLQTILLKTLEEPDLPNIIFAIDGIDECVVERNRLFKIIARTCTTSKVRWLLTSRGGTDWRELSDTAMTIDYEHNDGPMYQAFEHYITTKAKDVPKRWFDKDGEMDRFLNLLRQKCETNLLVASLYFAELNRREFAGSVSDLLEKSLPGLDPIYDVMFADIGKRGQSWAEASETLFKVLLITKRPLELSEIAEVVGFKDRVVVTEDAKDLVNCCRPFLKDRSGTVELLHQSATQYLRTRFERQNPAWQQPKEHTELAYRLVQSLSNLKTQKICGLSAHQSVPFNKNVYMQSLKPFSYAYRYWIDHFVLGEASDTDLHDDEHIKVFFQSTFLHWIEYMCASGDIRHAIEGLRALLVPLEKFPKLHKLVRDAERFVLSFGQEVESDPSQLYQSALSLAPYESEVCRNFWKEERPKDLVYVKGLPHHWGNCLQTLSARESVYSVAISSKGTLMASASADKTVRLWDAVSGIKHDILHGHSQTVKLVIFSPDGRLVASSSDDHTVRIWNVDQSPQNLELIGHDTTIRSISFSNSSLQLVSASGDGKICLWDSNDGTLIKNRHKRQTAVTAVFFSLDNKKLVACFDDGCVEILTVDHLAEIHLLQGHQKCVRAAVFYSSSSKVEQLVTASDDCTLRLWDLESGEQTMIIGRHRGRVLAVAISPDGKLLASASTDHDVRLWRAAKTKHKCEVLRGHSDMVTIICFSPDSLKLASVSVEGIIRLWDMEFRTELATFRGHNDRVTAIAFTPDSRLLVSSSIDGSLRQWQANKPLFSPLSARQLRALHKVWSVLVKFMPRIALRVWRVGLQKDGSHKQRVRAVEFAPSGKILASASDDTTIKLWYTKPGSSYRTLRGHHKPLRVLVFSRDSGLLASGAIDGTVRLWLMPAGILRKSVVAHKEAVTAMTFSHDSRLIATGSDDCTVRVWSATAGLKWSLLTGHTHPVCAISFSPRDDLLASASQDGSIRLWEGAKGTSKFIYRGHRGAVNALAFDHTSTMLASASSDCTIRLWNTGLDREQGRLDGHTHSVSAVAFYLHSSEKLVSASEDCTIRCWDGGRLIRIIDIGASVTTLEFSSDAGYLKTNRGRVQVEYPAGADLRVVSSVAVHDNRVQRGYDSILKIPRPYLPTCVATWGSTVGWGCDSGQVITIGFKDDL